MAIESKIVRFKNQMAAWEAATGPVREKYESAIKGKIASARRKQVEKFPEDVQQMYKKPESQKTPYEKQVSYFLTRQADEEEELIRNGKPTKGKASTTGAAAPSLKGQLKRFDNVKPTLPTAFVVTDVGTEAPPVTFKSRRDGETTVNPGFMTLMDPKDAVITPPKDLPSTGRRTALAQWLASPQNPLTARVIVNRVWQYHFGRGLVGTSSDFGRLGEKPSHPELLDWLTTQFIQHNWSLKWLHHIILTSATYRQTARIKPNEVAAKKDPDNHWFWRMSPHRLDASQARDAILAMSGELEAPKNPAGEEPSAPCRAVYTKKIRNHQDDFLRSFDAPAGFQSVAKRDDTTTPLQSLLLINGDWPLRRANAMASNLLNGSDHESDAAVAMALEAAFGRPAKPAEVKSALDFIQGQKRIIEGDTAPTIELASPLVDAKPLFGRGVPDIAQGIQFRPGSSFEKIHVIQNADREGDEFTVEAIVYLDSLYSDGSVRTIVSRWNNDKGSKGWSLGVTSKGSRHEPGTLIMQMVGDDFQRSVVYEGVTSGIHLPLKTPYYIAAVVSNHPPSDQLVAATQSGSGGADTPSGGTVTFYAKNLADPKAQFETMTIPHQLVGGYVDHDRPLLVAGRDSDPRSLWDGVMARISLSNGALQPTQLLVNSPKDATTSLFDLQASTLENTSEPLYSWESGGGRSKGKGKHAKTSTLEAFGDFCHVLMNSNEFLYLH